MPELVKKNLYMFDHLNRCSALSRVDKKTLTQLWLSGRVRKYSKGETILHAKESLSNIYFLLSGKAIQYNLTHFGKRKILFVFGEGNLLNDHVFDSHLSSIYCEALEECLVFSLPKDDFVKLMERNFSLVQGVMMDQEKKFWRLSHQLKNTVGNIYMERKLAAKLWKLARDFGIETEDGIEIDINMSMSFLADMLGTPRETASRLCKSLKSYGLIRQEKKHIIVCDKDRLSYFYKTGEIPEKNYPD